MHVVLSIPPGPVGQARVVEYVGNASRSVLDVENLRLHYARTLEHWQTRYDDAQDEVIQMFDQDFSRAWRLYLAGSVAAFLAGSLQLFQVLFVREQNNLIPWSRLHQYRS